jgi:hypothetical protein
MGTSGDINNQIMISPHLTRANLLAAVEMVSDAYKAARRDKREPGRRRKELMEDFLQTQLLQLWRRQRKRILEKLERSYPDRKAISSPPITEFDADFDDDDMQAQIIRALTAAMKDGILLFGESQPLKIDYTLVNVRAAQRAREYAYDLVKNINDTTRKALQDAIAQFIETPGFRIGDVMELLPFDEERARLITQSEITRVYAQANQLGGQELKKQFPGVRIEKTWFTNRDTYYEGNTRRGVCEICESLEDQTVEIDEKYHSDVNGKDYDGPGDVHPGDRCWEQVTTRID